MTEEKHLDPAVADQIGEFVKLKGTIWSSWLYGRPAQSKYIGGPELIDHLRTTRLSQNKVAKAGLEEMELLFKYLDVLGVTSKVRFPIPYAVLSARTTELFL